MTGRERRAGDPIVLPVFLVDDRCSVEQADGEVVGFGYKPFLDEARTVELTRRRLFAGAARGLLYAGGGCVLPRRRAAAP